MPSKKRIVVVLLCAFLAITGTPAYGASPATQPVQTAKEVLDRMWRAYRQLKTYQSAAILMVYEDTASHPTLMGGSYEIVIDHPARRVNVTGSSDRFIFGPKTFLYNSEGLFDKFLEVSAPKEIDSKSLIHLLSGLRVESAPVNHFVPFDVVLSLGGEFGDVVENSTASLPDPDNVDPILTAMLDHKDNGKHAGPIPPIARNQIDIVKVESKEVKAQCLIDRETSLLRLALLHVDSAWLGLPKGRPLILVYAIAGFKSNEVVDEKAFVFQSEGMTRITSVDQYRALLAAEMVKRERH